MLINITIEVESREELVEILQIGSAHSLLDYQVVDFKIVPNDKEKEHD